MELILMIGRRHPRDVPLEFVARFEKRPMYPGMNEGRNLLEITRVHQPILMSQQHGNKRPPKN